MFSSLRTTTRFVEDMSIIMAFILLFLSLTPNCDAYSSTKGQSIQTFESYDDNKDLVSSGRTLIIGGSPATLGQFPSFVIPVGTILCGGTLIHEDIILTAAHCGVEAFADGAYIGGNDIAGFSSVLAGVETSIMHPSYNDNTYDNDVMLVKLVDPSSAPIQAVNLDDSALPADGEELIVIGFGDTVVDGTYSDVLRFVNVNVIGFDECDAYWGRINNEIHLCAGVTAGGRDSCQGDSGGPLMTTSGVQVGIVSNSDGCGAPNTPALYARTSGFGDWIRSGICDLSDNPPSTCGAGTPVAPVVAPTGGEVPTTPAPTTPSPTTPSPTTPSPTTPSPVAVVPSPTTVAPTPPPVAVPSTPSPIVIVTTPSPVTAVPTTVNPTTWSPVTSLPTTSSPTTFSPVAVDPTTSTPTASVIETSTIKPSTTRTTTAPTSMNTNIDITSFHPTTPLIVTVSDFPSTIPSSASEGSTSDTPTTKVGPNTPRGTEIPIASSTTSIRSTAFSFIVPTIGTVSFVFVMHLFH